MYCPNCGKMMNPGDSFCPGCGKPAQGSAPYSGYNGYATNTQPPEDPPTLVPFLLGLLLGIIGVIIAVLVYNGNQGNYTKNPTTHALIWSLIGMFIWVPIILIMIMSMFALYP